MSEGICEKLRIFAIFLLEGFDDVLIVYGLMIVFVLWNQIIIEGCIL